MRWGLALAFTVALTALMGCPQDGGSSSTGADGGGDGGVDCPNGRPVPMLDLTISAQNGPVPPDTRVLVNWSAGPEAPFELDDPKTWGTPTDNVICDVDPTKPPPTDLAHLVCHLWTSGVTHVQVRAAGYVPFDGMLKPKYSATCKEFVTTAVSVTLQPVPDAGTGGVAY